MTRRPPIATRTDTLFPDPTLFRSLQDHVVLIGFSLEFVDLPLAEGVVQGLVDIAGGEAKARRRAAVDVDVGDTAAQLQIVGDVPERGVRSEEHTSELQSLMRISYAVFCLNKKT